MGTHILWPWAMAAVLAASSIQAQNPDSALQASLWEAPIVGGRIVDRYKVKKYKVEVYFFDPADSVAAHYVNFKAPDSLVAPHLKLKMWRQYLYDNAVYLFVLKDKETPLRYYCLRGRAPDARGLNMYCLESVRPEGIPSFDVFGPAYQAHILKTYRGLQCSGMLFEHMRDYQTPEGRALVGKEVPFLGTPQKVLPYMDVKNAVEFFMFPEFKIE